MTQSTNKFEQLLELLINEENDKAQALFHEIVVEKSRDIYEGLAETETAVEAKDMKKDEKEEVKETEKTEAKAEETVKETEKTDSKDESVDEEVEIEEASKEEESIEEVGGDATDDLIADVTADEKGDAEMGADANGEEMPGDEAQADAGIENKIVDLEDALEELKAEFEKMMNGDNGEDKSEESVAPVAPAQDAQAQVAVAQEAKKDDMKKETVKEYKIKKTADTADHSDKSAKSPVASKNDMGGTVKNIAQAAEDNAKVSVAKPKAMGAKFENEPGKDKATTLKPVKANMADGSDKSAKSTISGK